MSSRPYRTAILTLAAVAATASSLTLTSGPGHGSPQMSHVISM